jgi:hypothetical protein
MPASVALNLLELTEEGTVGVERGLAAEPTARAVLPGKPRDRTLPAIIPAWVDPVTLHTTMASLLGLSPAARSVGVLGGGGGIAAVAGGGPDKGAGGRGGEGPAGGLLALVIMAAGGS